jgi:predicted peptidase
MPQTAKTYQISAQSSVDYLLYLPEDFQGSRTYPLILFLHGSGERGNDINLVRKYGLPLLLDQPAAHPYAAQFMVVSPQCPADIRWIERSAILDALLAHVQETLPIDPTRIY